MCQTYRAVKAFEGGKAIGKGFSARIAIAAHAAIKVFGQGFADVIDGIAAVAVVDHDAVLGANPARLFLCAAIMVDVKQYRAAAVVGQMNPISIKVDDQRVSGRIKVQPRGGVVKGINQNRHRKGLVEEFRQGLRRAVRGKLVGTGA